MFVIGYHISVTVALIGEPLRVLCSDWLMMLRQQHVVVVVQSDDDDVDSIML
jgi:hypothetical protein